VPARHLSAYDKLRDKIVRQIAQDWQAEEARLKALKARTLDRILALKTAAAAEVGIPELGGRLGNIQVRSFDGNVTVTLDRPMRTEFDERLALAQQLIMEAIREMRDAITVTDDSTAAARQAVEDLAAVAVSAFTPRRSGNLDRQRIRDLRKIPVKHPKWKQACDIIGVCERAIGQREYVRVAIRADREAQPEPVILDIAAL